MLEVKFYENVADELFQFAVIIAKSQGKWVFCKHKERDTFEIPGGHREPGESIEDTARRELREETGALKFELIPVCVYSVTGKNQINKNGAETFGMLYFAEIFEFEPLPQLEIENIEFFAELPQEPDTWTYSAIQPKLTAKIREFLNI